MYEIKTTISFWKKKRENWFENKLTENKKKFNFSSCMYMYAYLYIHTIQLLL